MTPRPQGPRDARLYVIASGLGSFGLGVAAFYLNFLYRALGFDDARIGLLAAALAAGALVGAYPAARLGARVSRRTAILAGGTITAAGVVGLLVVDDLAPLLVVALCIGAGGVIVSASGSSLMADATSGRERGSVFGEQIALITVAAFLASLLAGALADQVGALTGIAAADVRVIRIVIAIGGALAAISALPILFVRSARVPRARHDARAHRSLLVRFAIVEILLGAGAGSFLPFVNLFLVDRFALSFTGVGLSLGIIALAGSAGAIAHGRLGHGLGPIRSVVLVEVASLPFALAAALAPGALGGVATLAVRALLMYGAAATYNAYQKTAFAPAERAGAHAILAIAYSAASAPASIASGAIRSVLGPAGYAINLATLIVLYAAAAACTWAFFRGHEPRGDEIGSAPVQLPDSPGMSTPNARTIVADAIRTALARAAADRGWSVDATSAVEVERPKERAHGDYASGIAMRLARPLRRPPLEIAEAIRPHVAADAIASVEVATPGFLNVRLRPEWVAAQVDAVADAGADIGRTATLRGKKIQVEYVSANPTGPLTLANARGGPLGDVLANVLALAGALVTREYYVEDGGMQVRRFGESVAVRYRQLFGEAIDLPADGYQGEYVKDIAAQIKERHGAAYRDFPLEEQGKVFGPMAIDWVVADAQRVTAKFGIHFDSWFKQSSFIGSGYLDRTIDVLREKGVIVDRDGVVFFETPDAVALRREGDEGWVLANAHGPLYLGTDIAYHRLCLEDRGFDRKIDVWGANTQYHLAQMKIALPILGIAPDRFEVVLYQYVRFLKEGVLERMGRRTGQFLLLEDVLDAVGADVARFFLLQSGADRQLDFDFELAVRQSNENPVYYVQYAHARIASIFRTAAERGLSAEGADVSLLTDVGERELALACLRLPELLEDILEHRGVHLLTGYALELAGLFHAFYRDHRVVSEDEPRSRARLRLVQAVQTTLKQTLALLGVSAPEKM